MNPCRAILSFPLWVVSSEVGVHGLETKKQEVLLPDSLTWSIIFHQETHWDSLCGWWTRLLDSSQRISEWAGLQGPHHVPYVSHQENQRSEKELVLPRVPWPSMISRLETTISESLRPFSLPIKPRATSSLTFGLEAFWHFEHGDEGRWNVTAPTLSKSQFSFSSVLANSKVN